jgi:hypothetical protein
MRHMASCSKALSKRAPSWKKGQHTSFPGSDCHGQTSDSIADPCGNKNNVQQYEDSISADVDSGLGDLGKEGLGTEGHALGTGTSDLREGEPEQPKFQEPYSQSSRTLSSGTPSVIETFVEVEGGKHAPGSPLAPEKAVPREIEAPLHAPLPRKPLNKLHADYFVPFECMAEYELAKWLFESQTTAGDMKKFFETSFGPFSSYSSIDSVQSWKSALHRIPYGIPNDQILERTLTVELLKGLPRVYTIIYRPIVRVIEFLIGHEPFKPNLAYAPVRLYADEEKKNRIYNEMHSGTWWWDIQKQLPPGATLVPIIIASNKTQLTQHKGDKSSWPIYVTIGNLDKALSETAIQNFAGLSANYWRE